MILNKGYKHLSNVRLEVYKPPTSKPNYLAPQNLRKSTTTKRISDHVVFNTTGQNLEHNYSTDQCFNVDGSLVKLAGYPAAILNGNTYELIRFSNIPSVARFSNKQRTKVFGVSENRKFVMHDVLTDEREDVFDFGSAANISFGKGESNQDYNDRFVVVNDGNEIYIIDIPNKSIHAQKELPSGNLDWVSVSPLGNYVVVSWVQDGSGNNQGLKRFDIDLTNETHLTDYTEHSAMGLNVQGQEVYIQYGNARTHTTKNYLELVNLTTGEVKPDFYHNYYGKSGIWGGHLSMPQNERGVVCVSEKVFGNYPVLANEIFLYKIGTNRVKLLGKCNHSGTDGGCKASISRDGKKVIYRSDYHSTSREAYVLEIKNRML